jgi:hypothetical protein
MYYMAPEYGDRQVVPKRRYGITDIMLREIPEERRSHLHRSGIPISRRHLEILLHKPEFLILSEDPVKQTRLKPEFPEGGH